MVQKKKHPFKSFAIVAGSANFVSDACGWFSRFPSCGDLQLFFIKKFISCHYNA